MVGRQYVHGTRGIWNKPVNPNRKPRVNQPIEIDCHETQKPTRDKSRDELQQARSKKEARRAVKLVSAGKQGAGVSKPKKSRLKKTVEPIPVDIVPLPENEALRTAAKRVLPVQSDILDTKKRLRTLESQLALLIEKLRIEENLAKPAPPNRSPSKARVKAPKK